MDSMSTRIDRFKAIRHGERKWIRVVLASECSQDGNCPQCGIDYADCPCPGPTQDGHEYKEINGLLFARRRQDV